MEGIYNELDATTWNERQLPQTQPQNIKVNDDTLDEIRSFFKETKRNRPKGQIKPFKCTQCPSRFTTNSNMAVHLNSHHNQPDPKDDNVNYVCEQCSKTFKTLSKLKAHHLVHKTERPFECKICGLRCKVKGALKAHYKLHAGLVFKCSICGKDFNNINNMKLHEEKHKVKIKKFACEMCGKSFKSKCLLTYHMRIHTGEKPFKCSVCGMGFALKSNMRQHFRTHTGEKPFKCDICDKSFNQTSALTCHKRSHVTFKPHQCQHCNKQFGQSEELISHMRLHGIKQMFQCKYCDLEFEQHNHLKSHVRLHTEMDSGILKRVAVVGQELIQTDDQNNDQVIFTKKLDKKLFEEKKPVGRPKTKKTQEVDKTCKKKSKTKPEKLACKKSTTMAKPNIKIDIEKDKAGIHSVAKKYAGNSAFENVYVIDSESNGLNNFRNNDESNLIVNDIEIKSSLSIDSEVEVSDDSLPLLPKRFNAVSKRENLLLNTHDEKSINELCQDVVVRLKRISDVTIKSYKKGKNKSWKIKSDSTEKEGNRSESVVKEELNKLESTKIEDLDNFNIFKIEPDIEITTLFPDVVKYETNTSTDNYECLENEEKPNLDDCVLNMSNFNTDTNDSLNNDNIIKSESPPQIKIEMDSTASPKNRKSQQKNKKAKKNVKELKKGNASQSYNCLHCRKRYALKLNFYVHQVSHQTTFDCPICELPHETLAKVRLHLKSCCIPDVNDNYVCSICNKGFKSKTLFDYHITGHTGEKPFKCDICGKSYRGKYELMVHMRKHMDIKPFNCEQCGAGFITKSHLNAHTIQHATVSLNISCSICKKLFKSQGRLYNHMKIHREDAYKCAHCGKGFKVLGNLKSHEVRHTGGDGTTYPCTVCGKSFQFKIKLSYHMRTHTGERPHGCTLCTRRFADVSNLQKHMRIHTGEKPYKCEVCGKEFNQLSSLNSHKKSHLTYKPHKCKYCPKSFALDVDLIVHLRTHGEIQMFKCTMCDKEYSQLCHLKSHRRLHFGSNEKPNEMDWPNAIAQANLANKDAGENVTSYGNNYNIDIQGWDAIQRAAEVKID